MHRLPGDLNPSTKPVHMPTAPPKCLGPHCTMQPLSARHWGLGAKATHQPNGKQSLSLHSRSLPATPHIRNNHFNKKWVSNQSFWWWHSGHHCRNNSFAHGKSLCVNDGHNQQACNADECVPPTASSKNFLTPSTATGHHESNGYDVFGRYLPRCSSSSDTTTICIRPTTDLPIPSITALSTRVLQYAPAIWRVWTHGGTRQWTQLRWAWTITL